MKLLLVLVALIAAVSACKDRYTSCPRYVRYCRYYPHIRKLCPKTCNQCTGPQPTVGPTQDLLTQAPGSCGQRQVSFQKVIGGVNARQGAWPWQILLQRYGSGMCGGTLISKRYVVTASHCVGSSASAYSVVVGENDRTRGEGSEKVIKVAKVIMHPRYSRRTLDNDIALLKLDSDVTFGKYVQPACLPSQSVNPGHSNCYITGWGKIQHPGRMHTRLQQAVMPPVDSKTCYAKNRQIWNIPITKGMICAGEGGVNTISGCHGDSGGPYVCQVNGKWELQGAVSWGSGRCKSTETYTVFARVAYYRQWISDTMRRNGN